MCEEGDCTIILCYTHCVLTKCAAAAPGWYVSRKPDEKEQIYGFSGEYGK
jgi:hypothetical protein